MKPDITLQMKVAELLEAYPALEEKLMEFSPAFAKLRNPILRRTVARITSLQQAASVAGIAPATLIARLREAAGLSPASSCESDPAAQADETGTPGWFDEERVAIRFDAAALIERGEVPLQPILQQAGKLNAGEIMLVQTPFRTVPVTDLLRERGFRVWICGDQCFAVTP